VEQVLNSFGGATNGGLVVLPDSTTVLHRDLIVALAAKHRLPAVYPFGLFVGAGGLMSYGTDQIDMFRLAAYCVDRILRGDKPADLPVQAPTKFETAVNTKSAKAMGLAMPAALLVAADADAMIVLLCTQYERPRGRRAAQECDELAPSHLTPDTLEGHCIGSDTGSPR
jgi:putative ABC transport system substrate-binding protein